MGGFPPPSISWWIGTRQLQPQQTVNHVFLLFLLFIELCLFICFQHSFNTHTQRKSQCKRIVDSKYENGGNFCSFIDRFAQLFPRVPTYLVFQKKEYEGVATSKLLYKPQISDDGRYLTCRSVTVELNFKFCYPDVNSLFQSAAHG